MLLVMAMTVAPPVWAQTSNAVNTARIDVLERKLKAVQARMGISASDGVVSPAENDSVDDRRLVADLSAKIGGIERQMRQLTGRLEEFEFKQRQFEQSLEMLRKEMALQREDMLNATSKTPALSAQEAPVPAVAAVKTPEPEEKTVELPEGDSATQYKYAFGFIQKNDLDSGREAMEKFIKHNPEDSLVGNAKFWLGRIHLQQGKNGLAAQQLFSLIEDHPNHPKRADALVDLAEVLVRLESNSDACNALAEFRRVSAGVPARLVRRAEDIGKKANCS